MHSDLVDDEAIPMNETGAGASGRNADSHAIAAMRGVLGVYCNPTSWWNNASFLLPLLATVAVGVAGLLTRRSELLGFAAFLAVVTLAMTPIVLAGWRQTATAVVLTRSGITSLHEGRVLKSLNWVDVTAVRPRETQGNLRWELHTADGERLLLDGELEHLTELVRLAQELAGGDPMPEA